ncbi:leucyl aminopeptidase [Kaistia nematophila]|uniref:Probable cytosol aminopeptidase n=1 Tax=Kaistia nematophila TaxID=2994654 RepID=A0A9X3ECQ8_9HYPH|nr:leucyl aminopeptidase [Kaistia nematophila]MBN9024142.1 leucyl aminopeptidase [Hyphomicrobiales bacterium]MCX5570535.1 leucyl aminopeptidase [Kaistia nematophila]
MTESPAISFHKSISSEAGTLVVLTDETLALGVETQASGIADLFRKAAGTADYKGKALATLDLLAPAGLNFDRLIVVGLGKAEELVEEDWSRLGGTVLGALRKGEQATLLAERPDGTAISADQLADIGLGAVLRGYSFDRYKGGKAGKDSKGENGKAAKGPIRLDIVAGEASKAKKAWAARSAIAEGAILARELVNEPANVLGPVEFAEKAAELAALGVTIETLTEKQMKKLGMRALLGVAQGSVRPPRLVAMHWNGTKSKEKPVAFVGKGVVFDTGGISIKPAGGMEDMKGDMGGAAAVVGLMHALASRKAKANVVGIIGLVENMPDGNAQRPGDIVEAASGVTIEIINTDAEGRLVLADALWYAQKTYEPKAIVDLATLTGAIMVALGSDHAGMFANDDALAEALSKAGAATGEKVWRMPLGAAYDKMIESKFADIKNTGGRYGGSITAAQFLKRFVDDGVAWAHLDIAGTAMGSPQTEINRSWASGWGVRILDRLVADNYEG